MIKTEDLYSFLPNGGVVTLNIKDEQNAIEKLLFLKPPNTVDFDINLDKPSYQPGDEVKLSLDLKIDSSNLSPNETFFASI